MSSRLEQKVVSTRHEIRSIEVLRFICALAVLFWHYQHFFMQSFYDPEYAAHLRPSFPFYSIFWPLYENGSLAVQAFWMISGFIFYRHYSDSIRQKRIGFFEFSVRRFSRLYPLHLATLIAVGAGQVVYKWQHGSTFIYGGHGPKEVIAQLLMASNWFSQQPYSFNGPIWSVSAEIVSYLAFFFVVRQFGAGIVVTGFACALCTLLLPLVETVHNVLWCGQFFFLGGLIQYFLKNVNIREPDFLILPAKLGNATYSSYLLHFPLQLVTVLICDTLGLSRSIFLSPIALVLFMGGTIVLSLVVYHFFEMPAQDFIRRSAFLLEPRK